MVEGEGSERPLYPTRITGSEILVNPFEDMVARVKEAPRTKVDDGKKGNEKKRKKPAGKNVLSFGGDEGDEDMAAPVVKKAKANPKLVSVGMEEPAKLNDTKMPEAPKEKKSKKRRSPTPEPVEAVKSIPVPMKPPVEDSDSDEPEPEGEKQSALDKTNAEIAALKASMKRTVQAAPIEKEKPKSALEAMIPTTSTRGRKRGKAADESGALDLFKSFKQRLEDMPAQGQEEGKNGEDVAPANGMTNDATTQTNGTADEEDEASLCDLHFIANCQSCKAWDDQPDGDVDAGGEEDGAWMSHALTFKKDTLGKDLAWKRSMETEIEVIDPREKARALKEESRRGKDERKGKGMGAEKKGR